MLLSHRLRTKAGYGRIIVDLDKDTYIVSRTGTTFATFSVSTDGTVTGGTWTTNNGSLPANSDQFEVKASNQVGTYSSYSSPFDVWLSLSETRAWILTTNSSYATGSFELEVREAGNTGNSDSTDVRLTIYNYG